MVTSPNSFEVWRSDSWSRKTQTWRHWLELADALCCFHDICKTYCNFLRTTWWTDTNPPFVGNTESFLSFQASSTAFWWGCYVSFSLRPDLNNSCLRRYGSTSHIVNWVRGSDHGCCHSNSELSGELSLSRWLRRKVHWARLHSRKHWLKDFILFFVKSKR